MGKAGDHYIWQVQYLLPIGEQSSEISTQMLQLSCCEKTKKKAKKAPLLIFFFGFVAFRAAKLVGLNVLQLMNENTAGL